MSLFKKTSIFLFSFILFSQVGFSYSSTDSLLADIQMLKEGLKELKESKRPEESDESIKYVVKEINRLENEFYYLSESKASEDIEALKNYIEKIQGLIKNKVNPYSKEINIPSFSNENIRGWSWDGKVASYLAVHNGKTKLHIRSFDGVNFSAPRELGFSSGDILRGWSWDGKIASYLAVDKNGKTQLIIRPFDGTNFSSHETMEMSSGDVLRGWNWDGKTASYLVEGKNGKTQLIIRPFDGKTFSSYKTVNIPYSEARGWSWNGKKASHLVANDKKLIIRPFNGSSY